jgi:hypothetical protein
MMSRKMDDSWSTWKAKGISSEPIEIKSKSFTTPVCPALTSKNRITLTIKETSKTQLPIMAVSDLDKLLRASPLIRKPISGNRGTR